MRAVSPDNPDDAARALPDLAPFLRLRGHVAVAHHVPGRIRLKLAVAALAALPGADPAPFLALLGRLPVKVARVNAAALSVVVEYDPRIVSAQDWHDLLHGGATEVAAVLRRHLANPKGEFHER